MGDYTGRCAALVQFVVQFNDYLAVLRIVIADRLIGSGIGDLLPKAGYCLPDNLRWVMLEPARQSDILERLERAISDARPLPIPPL